MRARQICVWLLAIASWVFAAEPSPRHPVLWYDTPAEDFMWAMPTGNGRLGAMVFGGVPDERIALNHDRLWRRVYFNFTRPVSAHLPEVRALAAAGKWREAQALFLKTLQPYGGRFDERSKLGGGSVNPYQPAGDLELHFPPTGPVTGYRRSLDLATAIATIQYQQGDTWFQRQTYCASTQPVIVTDVTCDRPGQLTFNVALTRGHASGKFETVHTSAGGGMQRGSGLDPECALDIHARGNTIFFKGTFDEGAFWNMQTSVLVRGGSVAPQGTGLRVTGADEAWVLTTIAVDQEAKDPAALCAAQLERAARSLPTLRQEHITAHQRLFNRVALRLGSLPADQPTDRWLAHSRSSPGESSLYALLFDYGRYLLICSSRPGGLPANLQGLWNEDIHPA
ncbi:MAG: glycoside hydrolase N-terminal domain-containing protein, partial [Verrucomicrobia bacterium]|nr:glycoside hydrolase N-terminal domain-containing protein [Verrucomicrobiota bacterium]